MLPGFRAVVILLAVATASPAAAQWSPVPEVPASDIFSVWTRGDTIVAGGDTTVFLSTDGGTSWRESTKPTPDLPTIRAALVHNGRLFAATFGEGVFVSDDLGETWSGFSQGLVGGIGNSVLTIIGMVESGNHLYAATVGAGAWTRDLGSGTWQLFGSHTLQNFQATNMDAIAAGGDRLFATGGFNGTVFYRDPGDADWNVSLLFNDRFAPGLAGLNALWTGDRWIVGSNIGLFQRPADTDPWEFTDLGLHNLFFVGLAQNGADLFASLGVGTGSLIATSRDDGVTWVGLDTLSGVGVYRLAVQGGRLYAGRTDGLWRRSVDNVSVPASVRVPAVKLTLAGSHFVRDEARFVVEHAPGTPATLEFFDVTGRRAGASLHDSGSAGPHEMRWNLRGLSPGVYLVRLSAGGTSATTRVVHAR